MKCKNDPKRTYKGTEPSPKGRGYCAHAEEVGTVKKGTDGNKWVVKTTKKGVKRWVKLSASRSGSIVSESRTHATYKVSTPAGSKQVNLNTKNGKGYVVMKKNGKVTDMQVIQPGENPFLDIKKFIKGSHGLPALAMTGSVAPKLKRGMVRKRTESWAKRAPKTKGERLLVREKCGSKCFIIPKKLKYPVCPKATKKCKVDCDGVRAARNRAFLLTNRKTISKEAMKDAKTAVKKAEKLGKKYCKWT